MLEINPEEQDALTELVNIGFGRAANALSQLVSQRVIVEAPEVKLLLTEELQDALTGLQNQEIVNVHQVFRGKLAGDAMLLIESTSASILVDMLNGGEGQAHTLDAEDREALIETGNILLNAFIGSFGNLLRVHLMFTVPHLRIESLADMLEMLSNGSRPVEYALMVKIRFRLTQGDVSGYVVILMGIQSLQALLDAMRIEGFVE